MEDKRARHKGAAGQRERIDEIDWLVKACALAGKSGRIGAVDWDFLVSRFTQVRVLPAPQTFHEVIGPAPVR